MSLVHTTLVASGWKLRLSKFGAIGKSCLLSVVTTNLRFPPGFDAVLLHEPLNPFFTYTHITGT